MTPNPIDEHGSLVSHFSTHIVANGSAESDRGPDALTRLILARLLTRNSPVVMRISCPLLVLSLLVAGCSDSSTPADATDAGVTADADASADIETDAAPEPLVAQFGHADTRTIRGYASTDDGLLRPLDLQFNPQSPNDLWIVSQDNDSTVILFDAGTEDQQSELFLDAFRNHFMEAVSSMAFGDNGMWGTCQESRNTYDGQAPPNDFMGPALWPSDLNVFAAVFQDPFGSDLGSHMDMLHESPNCMGIAHYADNKYFVFDGHNGHMVYYDFAADHGPGQDDHTDGIIHRYPEVSLTRVPGVPGHMEYHDESNRVFIADTGGARVLAYTVGTGERARDLAPTGEPLADFAEFSGAEVEVFISEGLEQPSGLAVNDGLLFVGDYSTGLIHAYDLETAELVDTLDSGSGELAGIEVAPDGRLWFIDAAFNEVLRVEP